MRRHRLAGLCTLTLLMCCGVMVAQAPSTGSVQGVVRDADTGTLLGGVEVELDINSRTPPRATTDAQGRYEMPNIPAGLTRVSLRRLFLNIAPPAVTATVREGQTTSMPELRVRLRGGMSGRVIDDTGQPLTGAFVMVVTRVFTRTGSGPLNELAGARLWIHRNSSTTTDDQGRFTFQMLESGEPLYVLASAPRRAQGPVSDLPAGTDERPPARAAAYYGGAQTIEGAVPIVLSSREERGNVEIVVPRRPSRCVSATLEQSGTPGSLSFAIFESETAHLVTSSATNAVPAFFQAMQAGANGRIRVCGLYDGDFTLLAGDSLADPLGLPSGATGRVGAPSRVRSTFHIEGRDLDLGRLSAEPAVIVTANVTADRADLTALDNVNVGTWPPGGRATVTTLPGSFQFQALRGVEYTLSIGRRGALYVKDLRVAGRSRLGEPLDADDAGMPAEVLIGSDGGTIVARVRDARGAAIAGSVVIALMDGVAGNPIAASAMADEGGSVTFSGLPPRRYSLLALLTPPPSEVQNGGELIVTPTPETIGKLLEAARGAERVDLRPNQSSSVVLQPK